MVDTIEVLQRLRKEAFFSHVVGSATTVAALDDAIAAVKANASLGDDSPKVTAPDGHLEMALAIDAHKTSQAVVKASEGLVDVRAQAASWSRLIRDAAGRTMRDGIGGCDALYQLAVDHGADPAKAAGFAHTINGAFALIEGNVVDACRLSAAVIAAPNVSDLSAQPVAPDALMEVIKEIRNDLMFVCTESRLFPEAEQADLLRKEMRRIGGIADEAIEEPAKLSAIGKSPSSR